MFVIMKFLVKYFSILFLLNALLISAPERIAAQSVSFQVFYDYLSPYGNWVDYPDYGFVWIPAAETDFYPYASNGHWVYTIYGWTWVSNYSWGWAPFHYGRWSYDSYYGWFWIPDNMWGPAWVAWRTSPGYYGWAPIGPGISINIVIGGGYNIPYDQWVFVPGNYMGRDDINSHYGPRTNNQTYIDNSTVVSNTYVDNTTNTTYIAGPRKEDVQKSGGRVKSVEIVENSNPGQTLESDKLKIYRPAIANSDRKNERPAMVADKNDITPISKRGMSDNKANEAPAKGTEGARKNSTEKPTRRDAKPSSTIKNEQPKQKTPRNTVEKKVPIKPKEEPLKQERAGTLRSPQKEGPQKQNAPMNNTKQREPAPQDRQPDNAPKQLQQERRQEPKMDAPPPQKQNVPQQQQTDPKQNTPDRVNEPRANVNQNPPVQEVPGNEPKHEPQKRR